ncbi:MAG: hypothetical protein K6E92_00630 [Lachnospiraceae bacterium]|nr:hypothetical protein [Lachnospiraceae bacterium]
MRITNKIMQRNNLTNINNNKVLEDKLTTQLSTEKKISRPSDDPVIAIRALRLRSNVTEVTQYYSKNIPDAESWLKVTQDALSSLSTVITSMQSQCTRGANGSLETKDRKVILEELQALKDEVYKTGDADYAGRYVFTGYRTDTPLSFQKATTHEYTITEQVDKGVIDSIYHVKTEGAAGDITKWTAANFNNTQAGIKEQDVVATDPIYRIRLAYNNCDATMNGLNYPDADGNPVASGVPMITYYEGTNLQTLPVTQTISVNDDPYSQMESLGADAVIYVPETGEILLGSNSYNKLMSTEDAVSTGGVDEKEIRITYQKTEWLATDLRPEHYFYTVGKDAVKDDAGNITVDDASKIEYNKDYLDGTLEKQSIEYDVGFNTVIRVNSTADECFVLGIGREVDDLITSMQQVLDLESIKSQISDKIQQTPETDTANMELLNNQMDAVEKALTYARDICQKRFERGITSMQGFLDDTSLAITNNGTRSSKLELIEKRLQNQKTTFETLQSENEDIDVTEVAINLSSAETTYQAALMATGKIMQNTLLNYI